MATADDYADLKKQSLKNTSLHVYHTKNEFQRNFISLEIYIDGFTEMNDGVIYSGTQLHNNWIMNVLKKDKTITLILKSFKRFRYDIMCYVLYDENIKSRVVLAEKNDDDDYIIKLNSEIIYDSQNERLKLGFLYLKLDILSSFNDGIIRLVSESKVLKKDNSIINVKQDKVETEEMTLMKDIAAMFYDMKFSDFTIKVKDISVPVHKSVIAARSKLFFDYLKENPDAEEVEIDVCLDALKSVLKYMYCGILCEESTTRMLAVIKLAKKLQMGNLCEQVKHLIYMKIMHS